MKTEIAVLIALTVALGELTTSATVLPTSAAFGGSVSSIDTGSGADLINLGYPGKSSAPNAGSFDANATVAYPFPSPTGTDDSSDPVTVSIGSSSFYHFKLTYDPTTSTDLTFAIWTGQSTAALAANTGNGSIQNTVIEQDVYKGLVDAGLTGLAKNTFNLTGLAFGFYAPATYRIDISNLALTGASFVTPTTSLTFSNGATGISDISNGYFLPATGLSDGFVLDGVFNFIRPVGTADQATKMGFEVYACVPEPATVAFGLAMVGGLGLVEIRRRKKA